MDSNHYRVVVYALSPSAIREVIVLFSFFNIVPNFVKLLIKNNIVYMSAGFSSNTQEQYPGEIRSVESCQAQKLSIGSSREAVWFLAIRFRLADPTGIPIKYDRIISRFIGFYRIPTISEPESDHRIECPGYRARVFRVMSLLLKQNGLHAPKRRNMEKHFLTVANSPDSYRVSMQSFK